MLSIVPFTDEADAVAKANDTEYGLVGYVYTEDLARGQRLIESLQTGHDGPERGRGLERGRAVRRRQAVRDSAARAAPRASTSTSRRSTR